MANSPRGMPRYKKTLFPEPGIVTDSRVPENLPREHKPNNRTPKIRRHTISDIEQGDASAIFGLLRFKR